MICSRHLPQMIPAVVLKDSKVHQIALLFAFKTLQAVKKNANFFFLLVYVPVCIIYQRVVFFFFFSFKSHHSCSQVEVIKFMMKLWIQETSI